jgi:hypothetical protein
MSKEDSGKISIPDLLVHLIRTQWVSISPWFSSLEEKLDYNKRGERGLFRATLAMNQVMGGDAWNVYVLEKTLEELVEGCQSIAEWVHETDGLAKIVLPIMENWVTLVKGVLPPKGEKRARDA